MTLEKKERIFISQPMGGKTYEEIETERVKAMNAIRDHYGDHPIEFIDSHFDSSKTGKMTPLECLGHSLILLSGADACAFLRGWDKARGCQIEHLCCSKYGIPAMYL